MKSSKQFLLHSIISLVLLVIMSIVVTSCGGDEPDDPTPTPNPEPETGIVVNLTDNMLTDNGYFDGNLYYRLNETTLTASVVGSKKPVSQITVPDKVKLNNKKYIVKTIGEEAFRSTSLTSIVLPAAITSIDKNAFAQCKNLESINLPENLELIGDWAFYDCGIKRLQLPNKLKHIGENAFWGCEKLSGSIEIPSGVTKLSNNVFGFSPIQEVKFHEALTEIGDCAFVKCHLKTLDLPSSLISIGNYAFSDNWFLTGITIPESVKFLGTEAFSELGRIEYIKIPASITTVGIAETNQCSPFYKSNIGYIEFLAPRTEIDCNKWLDDMTQRPSLILPSTTQKVTFNPTTNSLTWNLSFSTTITCYAVEPPEITDSDRGKLFETLYVPNESIDKYKNDPKWSIIASSVRGLSK